MNATNATSLLNHLEAYTAEEVAAKRRVLALLERQGAGVAANDPATFEAAARSMEAELAGNVERSRRRERILGALSELWRVPAEAMTLASIAERAGTESARLRDLRSELRGLVADVLRENRRLAALIGMHRRVTRDVIETVLYEGHGTARDGSGGLLNAEA